MIGNPKVHNWKEYLQLFIMRIVSQPIDNIRMNHDCIIELPNIPHNDNYCHIYRYFYEIRRI